MTTETAYTKYYAVIAPLIMGKGVGNGRETACLVAQAATIDALRRGETLDRPTDELTCACPMLHRMAIRANDANWWRDDAERTEYLRPLIPLLLDSRKSQKVTCKRIFHVVNNVVKILTPMRLEWISAKTKSKELKKANAAGIKKLRALATIKNKATCKAAREACQGLRISAYTSASAYADADAYAYASADAYASAYTSASASAYADASAYASASAYADASAEQILKYRTAHLALFREIAAITK